MGEPVGDDIDLGDIDTMDENLDWAASESSDIDVRSQGFDRGWFSSAGQHRIEVRDGELKDLLVAGEGAANQVRQMEQNCEEFGLDLLGYSCDS